jgi:hypothetical protein
VSTAALAADYERFAESGLPPQLEAYILDRYGLDLSSEYAGRAIRNPFGKASGQLSLNLSQVRRDAEAGLGFVVLKTVIAQDAAGAQAMRDWAIPETRMRVEPIVGARPNVAGRRGWTVTWKGRGWFDTFNSYLTLFAQALEVGAEAGMTVAPSVKYHLPGPGETEWRAGEYLFTTGRLLEVWQATARGGAMPIEKDFSPTLAGADRAQQKDTVLGWLRSVTSLIRSGATGRRLCVGLKVFNALFEDEFQVEMLRTLAALEGAARPDFLIYANRLFDPRRGVAYGGPDLSDRNLEVLLRAPRSYPLSATGDIHSGRTAAAYLLRGASSFQIHTFFQLHEREYRMKSGNKTACALYELLFHPHDGFIAAMLELRRERRWPAEWNVGQMAEACRR